ncbi:MAG: tetratricopeptide repeat protein [Bacteroidia bacterium]|nr:tetratricopeptide repeat protein [Bacteroidia bacterium]
MKYNHKISFLFILFSLFLRFGEGWGGASFAQNKNIDTLITLLKKDKEDSSKVNHLNDLGWALMYQNLDSSILLGNQALEIINHLNSIKGKRKFALLANTYGNLGVYHLNKADFPRALDFTLKALKLNEEIGNKKSISKNFCNIGIAYAFQLNYPRALDYYFKALNLAQEQNDKNLAAAVMHNIAGVYLSMHDFHQAIYYSLKSLKIKEELGNNNSIARTLDIIGNIYESTGDYPKALEYSFRALNMKRELGNEMETANTLVYIGSIYTKQKNYGKAYDYLYNALAINKKTGAKVEEKTLFLALSNLYESSNIPLLDSVGGELLNMEQMRLRSIYYYQHYIAIEDLIFSSEFKKNLELEEMNNEFDKKEEELKAKNRKQQAVAEAKSQKQKMIIFFVAFGFLLVVLFAGFIFRTLRITRRQKQLIESKSAETELQKKIIEEKNKDITDSIHYAKQIQSALLRDEEHTSMHLPEHFILFMPKDIVSGDFYWGAEKQQYWYFAAVDCTGHGVPGAIMSMLSISFLNDIISSEELLSSAEILNRLRDKVIKELRQTGEEGGSKDGMDISLCKLNLKTNELQWAGANNALNLIRNGKLEEIKADKQPIGYYPESRPFTNHEIQLQKGDSIYIYSDGYVDQFGGPKGKKFKYKQLEDLILANNHLLLKDQKEIYKKNFIQWKGSLEQVDDVCLFGVRV